MTMPKELTEQAFALYKKVLNLASKANLSTHKKKRLRLLAERANARYKRRLESWWRSK